MAKKPKVKRYEHSFDLDRLLGIEPIEPVVKKKSLVGRIIKSPFVGVAKAGKGVGKAGAGVGRGVGRAGAGVGRGVGKAGAGVGQAGLEIFKLPLRIVQGLLRPWRGSDQ